MNKPLTRRVYSLCGHESRRQAGEGVMEAARGRRFGQPARRFHGPSRPVQPLHVAGQADPGTGYAAVAARARPPAPLRSLQHHRPGRLTRGPRPDRAPGGCLGPALSPSGADARGGAAPSVVGGTAGPAPAVPGTLDPRRTKTALAVAGQAVRDGPPPGSLARRVAPPRHCRVGLALAPPLT